MGVPIIRIMVCWGLCWAPPPIWGIAVSRGGYKGGMCGDMKGIGV